MKPNGYTLFENDRIIVIATGFARGSKNAKTGAMIQTWVLYRALNPVIAAKTGANMHVCFDCKLKPRVNAETNKLESACYVRLGDAPLAIWRAYYRGNYRLLNASEYATAFAGKFVRFGSYGEPTLIPLNIIKAIASASRGWTGYTHQWKNPVFSAYREYVMASCDASDYQTAQANGWRTFTVSRDTLDKQVVCPASKEMGYRVSCAQCRLCSGTSRNARSIQIQPHGNGAKHAA